VVNTVVFDPTVSWIAVEGRARGPRGVTPVRLLVDTGASITTLTPHVLDVIGYSPRDGSRISSIRSAVSEEAGYIIRIAEFECFGFTRPDFDIHAHDLPEDFDIDGLVGINFLRDFNYEIRSREGRIVVEPA
jgi:hypothetical protein